MAHRPSTVGVEHGHYARVTRIRHRRLEQGAYCPTVNVAITTHEIAGACTLAIRTRFVGRDSQKTCIRIGVAVH
jgi:hypothetical protein